MPEPDDLNDPSLRDRAVRAAQGLAPFDVRITGGHVAGVTTGEIRAADVGLVGPLIASVHAPGVGREAVTCIDAGGAVVAPGVNRYEFAHRKLDGDAAALCRDGGATGDDDDLLGTA